MLGPKMAVVFGVLYSERHDIMDPCCLVKINQGITLTRAVACSRITLKSLGGSSVSRHLYPIVSTYIFASGCPSVRHHRKHTTVFCYVPLMLPSLVVELSNCQAHHHASLAKTFTHGCSILLVRHDFNIVIEYPRQEELRVLIHQECHNRCGYDP